MHGRNFTELAMAGRIDPRDRGLQVVSAEVYLAPMVAQWVGPTRAKIIRNKFNGYNR